MSQYRFIEAQRPHHAVRLLCQVLAVTPSGYYAWRAVQPVSSEPVSSEPVSSEPVSSESVVSEPALPAWEVALLKTFHQHKRRYGTRRLRVALRQQGHPVGRQAVRTALRQHRLRALQPKSFTPRTTDSTHGRRCAPNLVLDQPAPTQANRGWVTDITYLPLASGAWAYLCAFQDVASKRVVGHQVLDNLSETLVLTALRRALYAEAPTPGLVVHSDRGGQYCARAYRALLHEHARAWSQSRRGECYDNAQAESLWSRLKTEELEARDWPVFADLAEAQQSVAAYVEYYNHERMPSAIAYQTPQQAHQQLLSTTTLNCPV